MVSWQTVQSLLIFFGPLLLPRILATYRSIRASPTSRPRPLPSRTSYALTVLFVSALIALLSTLPLFSPVNVLRATQSRLQTQTGVIFTRLAAIRPLTAADEKLRHVFDAGGLDARLLYARFGPSALANCPIAVPGDIDSSRSYLFYALPSILAPHILHLFALGVATSGLLSGAEGARWRTAASIAGIVLATAELWFIATYDDRKNARSTKVNEVDFVYWKLQVWRGLATATIDGVLGWVIWLQATGRAFLKPPAAGERLANSTRALELVVNKARGLGAIRNATARDAGTRKMVEDYWIKEQEVMRDVFEEPEVVEAQRNALRRLDIVRIGRDAETYVESIVQIIRDSSAPG